MSKTKQTGCVGGGRRVSSDDVEWVLRGERTSCEAGTVADGLNWAERLVATT